MLNMMLAIANASKARWWRSASARGDPSDAHRIGWHGVEIGVAIAAAMGGSVYLLRAKASPVLAPAIAVIAAALPLLACGGVPRRRRRAGHRRSLRAAPTASPWCRW